MVQTTTEQVKRWWYPYCGLHQGYCTAPEGTKPNCPKDSCRLYEPFHPVTHNMAHTAVEEQQKGG